MMSYLKFVKCFIRFSIEFQDSDFIFTLFYYIHLMMSVSGFTLSRLQAGDAIQLLQYDVKLILTHFCFLHIYILYLLHHAMNIKIKKFSLTKFQMY